MTTKTKTVLQPMGDRIIVLQDEAITETEGGIAIPENAREKPLRGKVIAVGLGRYDKHGNMMPMLVGPGDTVIFSAYCGAPLKHEDLDYLVMRQDDVLCVERECTTT